LNNAKYSTLRIIRQQDVNKSSRSGNPE